MRPVTKLLKTFCVCLSSFHFAPSRFYFNFFVDEKFSFNCIREEINLENNCDHFLYEIEDGIIRLGKNILIMMLAATLREFSGDCLWCEIWWKILHENHLSVKVFTVLFSTKKTFQFQSVKWMIPGQSASWMQSHPANNAQITTNDGKFSRSRNETLLCSVPLSHPLVNLSIKTWAGAWRRIKGDEWEL